MVGRSNKVRLGLQAYDIPCLVNKESQFDYFGEGTILPTMYLCKSPGTSPPLTRRLLLTL